MAHTGKSQEAEEHMKTYTPNQGDFLTERENAKAGGVLMNRTKTIKAGEYLEVEIFPVVKMEPGIREGRRRRTPEQIRAINQRNAVKRLERLMNANFSTGDLMPHLTMDKPCSFGDMQRHVRNFIQRMRRLAEKRGAQLRYIYVIETKQEHGQQRHHVHGLINGGWITRDEVEKLWGHGLARVDRVQRQEKGLAGFARYITQQKTTQERLMHRRWGASKGLKQPKITISDTKFSRQAAGRIAKGMETDARAILEKKYPGYRLVERPTVKYSDWLPGAYIYAYMERKEGSGT